MSPSLECRQSERNITARLHGIGLSWSSRRAVTQAQVVESGEPFHGNRDSELERVMSIALAMESERAGFRLVALQDVGTIVHGGICRVATYAGNRTPIVNSLPHGAEALSGKIVVGFRPNAKRHNIANLLESLLRHPRASQHVARISELVPDACDALADSLSELGPLMAEYRSIVSAWHSSYVLPEVRDVAESLSRRLGSSLLCWKTPGGGAASAILLITSEAQRAINGLKEHGWEAFAPSITAGVAAKTNGSQIVVTAPLRVDLVGFADLGANTEIGQDGECLAVAITPRSVTCNQTSL